MRIYLAGPMRGVPEFNFPAFHKVAAKLRAGGHTVFSPAENDQLMFGPGNSAGFDKEKLRKVFTVDCKWICEEAEAVALLPKWRKSRGAIAERALGIALGLEILYIPKEWLK